MAGLQHLEYVQLDNTQVRDLSPLAQVPNLGRISIRETPVKDLTPLAAIKGLASVRLSKARVAQEQIDELVAALPDLVIQASP